MTIREDWPIFMGWQLDRAKHDPSRLGRVRARWVARGISPFIATLTANMKPLTEDIKRTTEQVKIFGEVLDRYSQHQSRQAVDINMPFKGYIAANNFSHTHVDHQTRKDF